MLAQTRTLSSSRPIPIPCATLCLVALAGLVGIADEPLQRAQPPHGYSLIAPRVAWEGETFSGVVMAETKDGPKPLPAGDQVVFNGEVVQTVKPDGTIDIPPHALAKGRGSRSGTAIDLGTTSATYDVQKAAAGNSTITGRVTFMPRPIMDDRKAALDLPGIARMSEIATSDQPFSVFGQGLDRLKDAVLLGEDGTAYPLGQSVGSALERIYLPRPGARLAKGTHRFVAWDDTGRQIEAPQTCKNPRLTLEGTRITYKGQPGELRVLSDTSGLVQLTGGEPQISLFHEPFPVQAKIEKIAKFLSNDVGLYSVTGRFWNREDLPAGPGAKRASAAVQPAKYEYDARSNRVVTRVAIPVQVSDYMHNPVPNIPVMLAVTAGDAVQYGMPVTDKLGQAVMQLELPGEVPAAPIHPEVIGLPGLVWLPQDKCCECKAITYTDAPPIQITSVDGFSASDGKDQLFKLLKDSKAGLDIFKKVNDQSTLAGWLRVRYKLSAAVVAPQGEKGEFTVVRSTSVGITAPNLSAWMALYRRGDLGQCNEPGKYGDTVETLIVKCPEEKRFQGYDYEVWLGLLLEPGAAPPAQLTLRITDSFDKCPGGASTGADVLLRWDTTLKPPKLNSARLPPPPKKAEKK